MSVCVCILDLTDACCSTDGGSVSRLTVTFVGAHGVNTLSILTHVWDKFALVYIYTEGEKHHTDEPHCICKKPFFFAFDTMSTS